MERVSVAEAGPRLDELVDRISTQGVTIELERDRQVVARISPACRRLRVADLNGVFAGFPSLGDDAESFARDVEQIRHEVPTESDPWA